VATLQQTRDAISTEFFYNNPNSRVNGVAIGTIVLAGAPGQEAAPAPVPVDTPQQILIFASPPFDCELAAIEQFVQAQGQPYQIVLTSRFTGLAAAGDAVSYYTPFRYNLPPVGLGSIGGLVKAGGGQHILGSNHALAHNGRAPLKTPIVSPGPLEDATCGPVIAELSYCPGLTPLPWPPKGQPINSADCALASVVPGVTLTFNTPVPLLAGPLLTPTAASKNGHTSQTTSGTVSVYLADVDIDFTFGTYRFGGMLGVYGRTAFAQPGDSGALTYSANAGIGLVTARAYCFDRGDNFAGYVVLLCPLTAVRDALAAEMQVAPASMAFFR
jgi:hypothetical protein